MTNEVMPGVISQDIVTVAAAVLLLALAFATRADSVKKHIVALGILGYLFYGYGIYAMERVYTALYLVYLAIFGLSFYAMIYGVVSIGREVFDRVRLLRAVRNLSVAWALFVAVLFSALWIGQLIPLMQSGDRIEFLYSVFVLDLSFIMPAFVILAVLSLKGLGLLLLPAMFILGFTLLFPVGVGELLKPRYGLAVDTGGLVLYLGISALFLIVAGLHLRALSIERGRRPAR